MTFSISNVDEQRRIFQRNDDLQKDLSHIDLVHLQEKLADVFDIERSRPGRFGIREADSDLLSFGFRQIVQWNHTTWRQSDFLRRTNNIDEKVLFERVLDHIAWGNRDHPG
ncbi:hypothetical protein WICPIJ_003598 [Wickerhamomyces pijperi]|uniref:Uncharacterized protein n=1 Tax=Wickerhamomyces pijperi TaxID=599730 RepID=A0A9P8Q9B3_WICPI|nr:hypothetical protein WICPIJ_003598 [Wickerhamomyces pijperi]